MRSEKKERGRVRFNTCKLMGREEREREIGGVERKGRKWEREKSDKQQEEERRERENRGQTHSIPLCPCAIYSLLSCATYIPTFF